ncbi:MAG: hypothetical protein M1819_001780 [Sarea resinae]|nr:MAG: hypothetical protein M1819_001780 [Sarea resinae]
MVRRNYVIAIIIIVLFVVITLVAFLISALKNRLWLAKHEEIDEEEEDVEEVVQVAA